MKEGLEGLGTGSAAFGRCRDTSEQEGEVPDTLGIWVGEMNSYSGRAFSTTKLGSRRVGSVSRVPWVRLFP